MSARNFLAAGALLVASTTAWSAEPFPASTLAFKNVFASRSGDLTAYTIVGTGMFRAPRTDDYDAFVASWMKQHPQALATVVDQSKLGPRRMDYIWVDAGSDSLNVDLVRQGILPGGMMADGVEYLTSIKEAAHLDVNSPDFPKRFVSDDSYQSFMKRVGAAETAARADKVGLWSDKYRETMEEYGYIASQGGK